MGRAWSSQATRAGFANTHDDFEVADHLGVCADPAARRDAELVEPDRQRREFDEDCLAGRRVGQRQRERRAIPHRNGQLVHRVVRSDREGRRLRREPLAISLTVPRDRREPSGPHLDRFRLGDLELLQRLLPFRRERCGHVEEHGVCALARQLDRARDG